MRVTLQNAASFSDVVNIVSELVSEIKIKFSLQGLQIAAIDPTNAAMLLYKLPASAFSHYDVEEEEDIGLNLDDFKQVLKRGKQESLSLEAKDGKLFVNFGEQKKNFVLSLMDIEGEDRKEPELKFATTLKVESSKFQEAVEDCGIIADSVLLSLGEKGFVLNARSSLHSAAIRVLSEPYKGEIKSRYSLDYLQKMVKASRLASEVKVQFSDDYPLKLHYITAEKAELSFILAPRVETD